MLTVTALVPSGCCVVWIEGFLPTRMCDCYRGVEARPVKMSGLMSRLPMLLQSELQPDFFLKDQSKSLLGHPFEGGTVEENGHNMADYGAAWRYQTDNRRTPAAAATPPGKRTRREYGTHTFFTSLPRPVIVFDSDESA